MDSHIPEDKSLLSAAAKQHSSLVATQVFESYSDCLRGFGSTKDAPNFWKPFFPINRHIALRSMPLSICFSILILHDCGDISLCNPI